MRSWSEVMCYWLADYYVTATVVLLAAIAAMGVLKQPARRLTVAWSALGGLAALAVLAAVPNWPRAGWPWRVENQAGVGTGLPSDFVSPFDLFLSLSDFLAA